MGRPINTNRRRWVSVAQNACLKSFRNSLKLRFQHGHLLWLFDVREYRASRTKAFTHTSALMRKAMAVCDEDQEDFASALSAKEATRWKWPKPLRPIAASMQ